MLQKLSIDSGTNSDFMDSSPSGLDRYLCRKEVREGRRGWGKKIREMVMDGGTGGRESRGGGERIGWG